MNIPPICNYCGEFSIQVDGAKIYPHRSDLNNLTFWYCDNGHDSAYVGCHKGTTNPLGRLADADLRKAKSLAHQAFDTLWKNGYFESRKSAYKWLSMKMGIPASETHIGMFDESQCDEVIGHCDKFLFPSTRGEL